MSDNTAARAVEPEAPKTAKGKSPSFHLLPNSETFHKVKDPITLHGDKTATHDDADASNVTDTERTGEHKEKSPSFHRLPNSETFHKVKDPLKLK